MLTHLTEGTKATVLQLPIVEAVHEEKTKIEPLIFTTQSGDVMLVELEHV
jgi:hypothetical protein